MAERAFGPYRLVRQIAVGGMAEIHLAKTRGIAGFEKFVALKMIHPNFAQDEQFIQMLIDEAKIAVQLQHVNIAQTFDLGRVGDTYYITMEFVDGADLYKILRRGSEQDLDMPLDVCAFVAKEAATGLDHAHRKRDVGGNPLGIVHRDVSPQNVLISHAGEVKLVDFGIAKATMRARQTQVGVIKGKYYYMSPEQAWGDPLDHRSDIFSCGIVLYEMMTGQMLYLEEDLHKLLEMVRRADIAPPTRLRRDIPPQLERIVMHALEKKPEDRYQSASDFATDLERFLHTYSPVFTASKLTAHLRKAVGDPVPIIEQPAPEARSPLQQTQPIDARELVHERSEISDENSVIFRMDELRRRESARQAGDEESTAAELPRQAKRAPTGAQATIPAPPPGRRAPTERPVAGQRAPTAPPARARPPTAPQVPTRVPSRIPTQVPGNQPRARPPTQPLQPSQPRPPTARPPTARPVPQPQPPPRAKTSPLSTSAAPAPGPGMISMSTLALQAGDLSEIEEMTSVSGPPGFDGGPTRNEAGPALDYGDYEPTMIDGGGERADPVDSEDGPTTTRDGLGVPLPQAVQLSSSETMPRPHAEIRSRLRPGPPAHPALAASSPTPAVSALRQSRSRRTPPGGVPQQNVLQAIVGAQPSEPMPTVQMRGVPQSSDGVPRAMPDGASSGAPTNPQAPWAQTQDAPIPGQHQLPVPYGPPGMMQPPPSQQGQPGQGPMPLMAPPTPPPGSIPVAMLPPHLVQYGGYGMPPAAQTIQPGYPYPYGGQPSPMSFTKQMQAAIELDDIPQRYKFQQNRTRRILVIAAVVALFVGGIGITVMLMRGSEETPKATVIVESTPAGAEVRIDGAVLGAAPASFATRPNARVEIDVLLPHYKPWHQSVLIPDRGGVVRVPASLEPILGRLRINSQPGGAEIWINGELRGVSPKAIDGLDPTTVKSVELRLKDYPSETRDLDWSKGDTLDLDVKFFRK